MPEYCMSAICYLSFEQVNLHVVFIIFPAVDIKLCPQCGSGNVLRYRRQKVFVGFGHTKESVTL